MQLTALLAALTTLDGLPALVRLLGHPAVWEELDPVTLPFPVTGAAVVGRAGGFEWLGATADAGAEPASRLSRALAGRGRTAGVLVLDPAARTLDLAFTLERTATLRLHLDRPDPAGLEWIRRLGQATGTGGVRFALRALEALGGEDAGRRFFHAFAGALQHTS